jgi:Kef-type K+ transport system membrane component KefB
VSAKRSWLDLVVEIVITMVVYYLGINYVIDPFFRWAFDQPKPERRIERIAERRIIEKAPPGIR